MVENSSEQFNTADAKEKDWGNFPMVSHFVGHLMMVARMRSGREGTNKYSEENLRDSKISLGEFMEKTDDPELIEKLKSLSDKLNQISSEDNVDLDFVDEIHQSLNDVKNVVLQKGIG